MNQTKDYNEQDSRPPAVTLGPTGPVHDRGYIIHPYPDQKPGLIDRFFNYLDQVLGLKK